MITNFNEITTELNEIEKSILPLIIRGFSNYSKDNPIKEPDIVRRFNERSEIKINGVRLRRLVNHIRINALLPLIATSKGYYVSYDIKEIESQVNSLKQRAKSIENCAEGLNKFLNTNTL